MDSARNSPGQHLLLRSEKRALVLPCLVLSLPSIGALVVSVWQLVDGKRWGDDGLETSLILGAVWLAVPILAAACWWHRWGLTTVSTDGTNLIVAKRGKELLRAPRDQLQVARLWGGGRGPFFWLFEFAITLDSPWPQLTLAGTATNGSPWLVDGLRFVHTRSADGLLGASQRMSEPDPKPLEVEPLIATEAGEPASWTSSSALACGIALQPLFVLLPVAGLAAAFSAWEVLGVAAVLAAAVVARYVYWLTILRGRSIVSDGAVVARRGAGTHPAGQIALTDIAEVDVHAGRIMCGWVPLRMPRIDLIHENNVDRVRFAGLVAFSAQDVRALINFSRRVAEHAGATAAVIFSDDLVVDDDEDFSGAVENQHGVASRLRSLTEIVD